MFEKTMVNGVLSPLGEKVEPGEPVQEAKKCNDYCAQYFDSAKNCAPRGITVKSDCTFQKCERRL
jgi:hypothetical protein